MFLQSTGSLSWPANASRDRFRDPEPWRIAERVRNAIESLYVRRLDGDGALNVTASLGVASSSEGDKDALIAEADAALYSAKRTGKNRTVRAPVMAANLRNAE